LLTSPLKITKAISQVAKDKNISARLREARIKNDLTVDQLFNGIKAGNSKELGQAITLVESSKEEDGAIASELIEKCLPLSGNSIRIGISGVPGVGKSSFIESFGSHLTSEGKSVAVLAIDPSSEKSQGSILGDKTRMNSLSQNKNAFIRPSPASGQLGGVAQKTRESILLCEAAGYDVILIETVGVGQSEISARSMVDFFLLLMLAGAGDELQGIKRGIMEIADALVITKADGENIGPAKVAAANYKNAMHLLPANKNGWVPQVLTCSSNEGVGLDVIWDMILSFQNDMKINQCFDKNRQDQSVYWMHESIKTELYNNFYNSQEVGKKLSQLETMVRSEKLTAMAAAKEILKGIQKSEQ